MRLRLSLVLLFGLLCGLFSVVLGSYDSYGTHLDSYAAAPIHQHHQPHAAAHSAGSYYHYHVPLVGQQQQPHYHHPPQQNDHHYLYLLLPLLLLLGLPLLLLPLLPLLLLPIGLSLLALLMPMMMMMAGGMMMMMMMMMGGQPMMSRSLGTVNEMRTIGELLFGDMSTLVTKYARSIDLDKCPERIACEIGNAAFPESASRTQTAKQFMNYIVDNAIPKGRTKRLIRQCREALWEGSKSGNCSIYHCQPTIRIYNDEGSAKSAKKTPTYVYGTNANATAETNYYSPYQQQYGTSELNPNLYNYTSSNYNDDLAAATAYYNFYNQKVEDNEVRGAKGIYSAFGTPVVKE